MNIDQLPALCQVLRDIRDPERQCLCLGNQQSDGGDNQESNFEMTSDAEFWEGQSWIMWGGKRAWKSGWGAGLSSPCRQAPVHPGSDLVLYEQQKQVLKGLR